MIEGQAGKPAKYQVVGTVIYFYVSPTTGSHWQTVNESKSRHRGQPQLAHHDTTVRSRIWQVVDSTCINEVVGSCNLFGGADQHWNPASENARSAIHALGAGVNPTGARRCEPYSGRLAHVHPSIQGLGTALSGPGTPQCGRPGNQVPMKIPSDRLHLGFQLHWDGLPVRPERETFPFRSRNLDKYLPERHILGLHVNLRSSCVYGAISESCPHPPKMPRLSRA